MRRHALPVLAVVDDEDQLVGTLSEEAIFTRLWTSRDTRALHVMSSELVQCRPEDSAAEAAKLLAITGAPVLFIASKGRLLGWLSTHELERPRRLYTQSSQRSN